MPPVVIDILFLALAASGGVAVGMWLRRNGPAAANGPPQESSEETARARAVMDHLREVAATVAARVGEHNSRVREISHELNRSSGQAPETVVAAVSKLLQANEQVQKQLDRAEKKLEEQSQRLVTSETQARTDQLTQLANRRAFDDEMACCLDEFLRLGRPSSVMMLDVDHFKKFNDTHGHQAGDEVLRGVARVLKENVRDSDIVARYGGEEFAIILPGSGVEDCQKAAERARAAIALATFHFQGVDLRVTASGGLAELMPKDNVETLVKRADDALYASKEAGRNCAHWHDGRQTHRITLPVAKAPQGQADEAQTQLSPKQPAAQQPKGKPAAKKKPVVFEPDPLPGVSLRPAFYEDVKRRVAEFKRGGPSVCVLLAQVDDFHQILQRRRHEGAGFAMRAVSQFFKATLRQTDHVAHFDEGVIGVLLPGAELPDAIIVAERVRKAIARCELPLSDGGLRFTVSIGTAECAVDDHADNLINRAKASLKMAVDRGRNRCYFHDGDRCEWADLPAAPVA